MHIFSRFISIRAISLVVLSFIACLVSNTTNAQTVAQVRQVSPFSFITISGTAKVELSQGEAYGVVVEASEADQDLITVAPFGKGDVLRINAKGGQDAKIVVTAPALSGVKVTEASGLSGKGVFSQEKFKIEATGATTVDLDLAVVELQTDLSGAAVATIKGTTETLNLNLSGASHARMDSLQIKSAMVNASGASSGKLNVSDKVEGKVTGAATVSLVAEPASNTLEVTSVASFMGGVEEDLPEDMKLSDVMNEMKKGKSTKKSKFNGHFKGIELGVNTYLNNNNELKLPEGAEFMELRIPASLTVNLNLLEANLPIIRQNLGLVTGLGIEFNNYKFEGSNYIRKINGQVTGVPTSGFEFEKSKLACSYLKVPFMLEFQTNSGSSKNSFHISAGANFGLHLRSHTKYNFDEDGKTVKEKEWDRFYLNQYRAAGIVKLGWGPLNFFAEYNVLPLFESGKGPELYPVSFGIALANWD
ncbi:MAG: head GIN domain-containing protein [Bacteroidales bacterium]